MRVVLLGGRKIKILKFRRLSSTRILNSHLSKYAIKYILSTYRKMFNKSITVWEEVSKYHLILWVLGGGILNKKEGNNRPLLSLSFFFFSKNLFNFFGGFSLNHRSDFRASKMEKTLAVHVVGSKDELEKSALGKSINVLCIPGIFNDFFPFSHFELAWQFLQALCPCGVPSILQ